MCSQDIDYWPTCECTLRSVNIISTDWSNRREVYEEFHARPIWVIRIRVKRYESECFSTTWYDVCRCSEEPLCSHCCAPWGPVYPTNDVKERMGGGRERKKTAYGSASYIKEATRCAAIHCQFALFVSCNPSSLPHSPRWLSRGNKGTSVVPTPSPSPVEPPFNELHTVSTAKSGLLLSNGISPLLSALGRASRSALSLQNTSTLPSATSQTGGGGGGGGNKWSV